MVLRVTRPSVVALTVALLLLAAPPTSRAVPGYRWPVDGEPVRAFHPPAHPFAAGHRGVDFDLAAGTPVRPMQAGVVTFAGDVAGRSWVTVRHGDGLRTTYGPLATVAVARGRTVGVDTVVGTAVGEAHATADGLLHVSARRGQQYVDPAALVLPTVVTLLGDSERAAQVRATPRRPTLVAATPPSPNHLVVLAGLTSATGDLPFDPASLGYGEESASQFSYRGVGGDGRPIGYDPADTWRRVHDAAVALRDSLRARWAEHPGQAVDLVGHSLGGLVAMYYLLVLHDPADPTLPPIGRVATLASPLEGADAAAALRRIRDDPLAGLLLDLVDRAVPTLDADAPVLDDLAPGSPVTDAVARAWSRHQRDPWSSPLANGTEVLTIGAVLDPVVPEHRSDLPGAAHRTVVGTHGGMPTQRRTAELLVPFLGGGPLPADGAIARVIDVVAGPLSGAVGVVEQSLAVSLASVF